jgi:hypothetical protein
MTKSNNISRPGGTNATVAPNLKLAGWLSITNAILTIPIFAMSLFLVSQSGSTAKLLAMILAGVSFILFIFIFLSLKGLLNTRFGFHDTDILINMLIWVNAVSFALPFLELFPALEKLAAVVPLVVIVLSGIVLILFAVKLLRLSDTLHGMLKPFAYTSLATGVCFATIVLIPIGLLVSIIADIILGIIFLRVAEFGKKA